MKMGDIGKNYIRLRDDCFLVRGAKNSALYDLKAGRIYQVRGLVKEVLELSSHGLSVEEIASRLGLKEGFLRVLSEGKVISFSPERGFKPFPVPEPKEENLRFMWLEVTSRCNLRCLHCYVGADALKPLEELPTEAWKGAIREGAALGCRDVQFTGGEATLRKDLWDLVEFAKAEGYEFVEIFTNATTLNRERVRWMAEVGVNVAVSLYSYRPEVHDRITGRKGSFERTVEGIRSLVEHEVPVRIAIIVMRENEEDVKGTMEFVQKLGVDPSQVGVDVVRPTGRGRDEDLVPKWYPRTTCPDFWIRDISQTRCWPGKIAITSQGDVIPCIFARDLVVGRYKGGNLAEIVRGPRLQKLWSITLDEVEVCRDCEYRYACWDCRAIAYTTTGNLYAKSPRCAYDPYDGRWPYEEGEMEGVPERPRGREDLIFREIDGEGVIFDPETGSMHSLTKTAALIWKLCDGRHCLDDIVKEILEKFEAQPDEVRRDVEETLRKFRTLGLLRGETSGDAGSRRM